MLNEIQSKMLDTLSKNCEFYKKHMQDISESLVDGNMESFMSDQQARESLKELFYLVHNSLNLYKDINGVDLPNSSVFLGLCVDDKVFSGGIKPYEYYYENLLRHPGRDLSMKDQIFDKLLYSLDKVLSEISGMGQSDLPVHDHFTELKTTGEVYT